MRIRGFLNALILIFVAAAIAACPGSSGEPPLGSGARSDSAYVPADIDEALLILERELSGPTLRAFREVKEEDVILFHFGLGMGLRNDWGLWRDSRLAQFFQEQGVHHPEEMSHIILIAFHRRLHARPPQIDSLLSVARDSEPADGLDSALAP